MMNFIAEMSFTFWARKLITRRKKDGLLSRHNSLVASLILFIIRWLSPFWQQHEDGSIIHTTTVLWCHLEVLLSRLTKRRVRWISFTAFFVDHYLLKEIEFVCVYLFLTFSNQELSSFKFPQSLRTKKKLYLQEAWQKVWLRGWGSFAAFLIVVDHLESLWSSWKKILLELCSRFQPGFPMGCKAVSCWGAHQTQHCNGMSAMCMQQ